MLRDLVLYFTFLLMVGVPLGYLFEILERPEWESCAF